MRANAAAGSVVAVEKDAGLVPLLRQALAAAGLLIALVVAAFLVWALPPLGPGVRALAALESGDGVTVTHTDDGWVFLPDSPWGAPATGLVFRRVDPAPDHRALVHRPPLRRRARRPFRSAIRPAAGPASRPRPPDLRRSAQDDLQQRPRASVAHTCPLRQSPKPRAGSQPQVSRQSAWRAFRDRPPVRPGGSW